MLKMRYKFHCSVIFLYLFVLFAHSPVTTCGAVTHSKRSNAVLDDYRFDDLEEHGWSKFVQKRGFTCDSCGNECTNACGTKNFRTCCFNYLRKRSDPNVMKSVSDKHLIDVILLQGRAALYTMDDPIHNSGESAGRRNSISDGDNGGAGVVAVFGDDLKLSTADGNTDRMDGESIP